MVAQPRTGKPKYKVGTFLLGAGGLQGDKHASSDERPRVAKPKVKVSAQRLSIKQYAEQTCHVEGAAACSRCIPR